MDGAEALDSTVGNEAELGALLILAGAVVIPLGSRVAWSNLRSGFVGRAKMVVSDTAITIVHRGLFRKPEVIDRPKVALASFDARPTPRRRFRDHPRFHLASLSAETPAAQPDWVYSKVTGSPFPILSHVSDVPNLVLLFTQPHVFDTPRRFIKMFPAKQLLPPPLHKRPARGLLIAVTEPDKALVAFTRWGVVRPLLVEDVLASAPSATNQQRTRRMMLRDNLALSVIILGQFALPLAFTNGDGLEPPDSETFAALGQICSGELPQADPVPLTDEGLGSTLFTDPGPDLNLFFDAPIDARDAARFAPDDEVGWTEQLLARGFEGGYARRWSAHEEVVFATVWRFESPEEAIGFESFARADQCAFLHDAWLVPSIEGAVGMTLFTGRTAFDQVTFVKGSHRFMVGIETPTPERDHARILELADLAVRSARGEG